MATRSNVTSVEAIENFRASLILYQAKARATLAAQQAAREAKDKPPKADEDAYKNALKSVPTPQNVDPWGNMRSGSSSSGH